MVCSGCPGMGASRCSMQLKFQAEISVGTHQYCGCLCGVPSMMQLSSQVHGSSSCHYQSVFVCPPSYVGLSEQR